MPLPGHGAPLASGRQNNVAECRSFGEHFSQGGQNGPRMRRVRGPHCKPKFVEFRGAEVVHVVRIFPFRANHRLLVGAVDSPI